MNSVPCVSVALVEDELDMRERLARVIRLEPSLRLAFAAASGQELLAWLADNAVDVLLVDLGLPDCSGQDVIRRGRRMQPACAVMVITMFGDEANMLEAFEAGASGYLLKDDTESNLSAHVMSLHAGGSPMSPIIARQLLMRWQHGQAQAPAPRVATQQTEALSPRESEVLNLVARGFTYLESAQKMGILHSTVQSHVRNIYGKLDVHNKTEAVFEARQLGLLNE
ncbi:response regulator transcription factor [Roseateles oligotrophus]|uniref:Response regulator transcription factor n=1 Tax=Roseateles oligotrophus TaxID=1769250 RepID=A0ABT2YD25_9BURK|nr:response regulator transcription factor [Roseateles oligotrophus]MCV2367929.1 response regulator transcription factor [Roseateles oligotrophus]